MRFGLDLGCWANDRGYGRYTRELVRATVLGAPDTDFVGFVDAPSRDRVDLVAPNFRLIPVPQRRAPSAAAAADGSRAPSDLLRFTRAVWREPMDALFYPSVYTYFPAPPRRRVVVGVHDAIAERFPTLTLPTRRARLFWHAKVALALRQSRLVVTVSDFAAEELVLVLGVPRERIRVTGEAASPTFRPSESPEAIAEAGRRLGVPAGARWFVYVGGFNPHKHVDVIIRAHAAAAGDAAAPPHLVLVGPTAGDVFHKDIDAVRAAIAACGTEALVHWPGFLPDAELRHVHSGAVALLLPSASEGFGLPAVEAAACGAPVIATTASPLPTLLEGGGIFVPPGDEAALTGAMRVLLADEQRRRTMGAVARTRAAAMSWAESARRALAALNEAAA